MASPKAAAEMALLVSVHSIIVISLSPKGLCVLAIEPHPFYLKLSFRRGGIAYVVWKVGWKISVEFGYSKNENMIVLIGYSLL